MNEDDKFSFCIGFGLGILVLLSILFPVFKLTDVLDWSWWIILIPDIILAIIGVIYLIGSCIVNVILGEALVITCFAKLFDTITNVDR